MWMLMLGIGTAAALAMVVAGQAWLLALTTGAMAVATAAAIRSLVSGPVRVVAMVVGPALVIALAQGAGVLTVRAAIAVAAMTWTIELLGRSASPGDRAIPSVTMLPACIAAVCAPSTIALPLFAASRLVTAAWRKPRAIIAVPIVAGLWLIVAVIVAATPHSTLAELWFGPIRATSSGSVIALGESVGPMIAFACGAGLIMLVRWSLAELGVVACALGSLLVDAHTGTVGSTTLAVAAIATTIAVSRFAALVRAAQLQTIVGATVGAMVTFPAVLAMW